MWGSIARLPGFWKLPLELLGPWVVKVHQGLLEEDLLNLRCRLPLMVPMAVVVFLCVCVGKW